MRTRSLSILLLALLVAGCGQPYTTAETQNNKALSAKFEVPRIAEDEQLTFKVTLKNEGPTTLSDFTVVASAGEVVASFPVPDLPANQERVVEGTVELGPSGGSFDFSARVLGPGTTRVSEVIRVARPEGLGGPGNTYAQSQQIRSTAPNEPVQFGEEAPLLAFGNLEEVEFEADVDHLIDRVETHDCKTSRELLRIYQEKGNERAHRFLLGSL